MADDPSNSDKSRARLRITSPETAEEIARRLERDRTTANREREIGLEQSLSPFRVGSVKALNAVPLTRGLENEIIYATPAQLAEMLRRDELDATLVSIVEPLLNDRYDILDGFAVLSPNFVAFCEDFPGARLVSSRSGTGCEGRLELSNGLPHAHPLRVGTTRAPFWLRLRRVKPLR